MRGRPSSAILAVALAVCAATPLAAAERQVPYWASISAGDAFLRTGPGRAYPATWRYRRANLPVVVVQVHESWRKIRDQEGTMGWMAAVLLSAERTAIVTGETQAMRGAPNDAARVLWHVASGVVGHIRHCARGWCEFNVAGKTGYVKVAGLWGVGPREVID